jgi:glucosylceramidase
MLRARPYLVAASLMLLLGSTISNCMAQDGRIRWKCSTQESQWMDKPDVPVSNKVPVPASPRDLVLADSKRQEQVIDGWGGCFNERGWKAMEVLSPADRDKLMRSLFGAKTGLNLNLCRTPIGASDYAITLYSLDETAGDYAMEHFSIERDKERLIPFIKAALKIRPDMKLWAVPWSPPSWMKSSNSLVGGQIKDDDKTLDALALYFARYVQAYKTAGLNISMVMPQNEPNMDTKYTSCLWTGEQLAKFIGYHLGPVFKKEQVAAKIFLGTLNESKRGGYAYWVGPSMQDPNVRQYLAGLGCQWDADIDMAETHFLFPDLKLMQTELECGKTNSNDWAFAEHQYQLAKKWFGAGASSSIIWNMVLDETGLSTANWAQCSPIVVDTKKKSVTYTPYYYCYKHFSYFIQPGAHVIATESTWGDRVAFVNPDGGVVVVMVSSADKDFPVALNIDGRQSGVIMIPAHSFNTFVLPPRPH